MKKYFIYLTVIIAFTLILTNIEVIDAKDDDVIENNIKISLDGVIVDMNEEVPYISNKTGLIMLPIRKINELLGNEVKWLDYSREVCISMNKGNIKVNLLLQLEKNTYCYENDLSIENAYFEIIKNRSYAPIEFFRKVLDFNIDYHESNGFVVISRVDKENQLSNYQKYNIDDRDRKLWDNTIKHYLEDELWTELYAYDAGHFLMIPMHAAFKYNESQWIEQFADHFARFVDQYYKNYDNIVTNRLNKLHYLYLLSQFMVLCEKTNNEKLIPSNLVNILNNEIYNIWMKEPAWQWARKPFEGGIKERLKWKLETKEVDKSYYRAVIDEELFTLAIAADLLTYENRVNVVSKKINDFKNEIIEYAFKVFSQEGLWREDNKWLFQPGVWYQHPDYAYAGNNKKINNLKPSLIEDIAMDSSHSHRFPLWINSFIDAFEIVDSNKKEYFIGIRNGLEKQFYENVLVKPSKVFRGYRTKNFMDGRNGIYRWNYPTQGEGNGYGPYELSGTLTLGWWCFLRSERINEVYTEIANMFPLPENVIEVYVGPNTSRERHKLVKSPDVYYNGVSELVVRLASKL